MKEKRIPLILYTILSILFLEIVFRAVTIDNFFSVSLLYVVFSSIIVSFLITFIAKFFNSKASKIIYLIFLFLISLWIVILLVYKNTFNVYFSFAMLGLADQVATFWKDALGMALKNIWYILVLFIPFITAIILSKKINFDKRKIKSQLIFLLIIVILVGGFRLSLFIKKDKSYSPYKIYCKVNDISLSTEKFGVFMANYLDIKKMVLNFQEDISFVENEDEEDEPTEVVYDYNNLDIDFDTLIANERDNSVKGMHQYFSSDSGTLQNEYTGVFKDKNLILFMAESFNEIAVSKEITPTLYKLINSSFVFENFYTPVNNSTIGGEFQELTGLFANNSILKTWRNGNNSFPMGVGTVYKNLGYSTYAYHDHSYTFQDRYKYLKAIGFDNFKGCRSGMEKIINCNLWPESDVEMIEGTVPDFINDEKFMVFYATVSGHGDYSWGNSMSKKNRDVVASLPYSDRVKAYIAAQVELDRALELLIQKLEEAGKLDDTVIALVGDHYPYMLSLAEVNEAASYVKDDVIEINRSNFILYNSKMETTRIDKVGSQIDVLPTIYNAFGVSYDSRLLIGNDILSTEPGLAIFNNRSWVTDKGSYFANSKRFVPKDGVTVDETYVENMNQIVANKINMSRLILEKNYYKKALGN